MSHIPPPPKLPSSFPSSEPEDSGKKKNSAQPVESENFSGEFPLTSNLVDNSSFAEPTVEHGTVGYEIPKPSTRKIYFIATIAAILMWFTTSSVGLLKSFQATGLVNDWVWRPSQSDVSSAKIFGIIFLVICILWAIGMVFAVAIHNIKTLDEWVKANYGWSIPKNVLFVLGVEETTGFGLFKPKSNYQSMTADFVAPDGVHKIAVVVEGGVPILMDMGLKEPLIASWEMFERHSKEEFKKDLWLSKGQLSFPMFALPVSGLNVPVLLIWSNDDAFDSWLESAFEDEIVTLDESSKIFRESNIEGVLAFRKSVIASDNDITDILFGYNWVEGQGLLMDAEELENLQRQI